MSYQNMLYSDNLFTVTLLSLLLFGLLSADFVDSAASSISVLSVISALDKSEEPSLELAWFDSEDSDVVISWFERGSSSVGDVFDALSTLSIAFIILLF